MPFRRSDKRSSERRSSERRSSERRSSDRKSERRSSRHRKRERRRGREKRRERESYDTDDDGMHVYEPTSHYAAMEAGHTLKYADYNAKDILDDEDEIYIVRQENGYLSILFSLVQTVILALMMWQCGVAPLQLK